VRQTASLVQALPSTWPHLPSAEQTLLWHCEATVQPSLFATAQVLVVALHKPEAHSTFALASVQLPSCNPSLGMAAPEPTGERHVVLERSQY
jgi:hypothetical protein